MYEGYLSGIDKLQGRRRHLSSPNEVSSSRNELYQIELLAKGTSWEPSKAKTIGYYLQTDGKALLLKPIPA